MNVLHPRQDNKVDIYAIKAAIKFSSKAVGRINGVGWFIGTDGTLYRDEKWVVSGIHNILVELASGEYAITSVEGFGKWEDKHGWVK